ncbi:hypothetical protein V3C99_004199 [Haemonchus contortus]
MTDPLRHYLELTVLPSGERSVVKKNLYGIEWEAEAFFLESTLEVTLWCNRGVESNVWLCEVYVIFGLPSVRSDALAVHGERIREALVKFHSSNRKHLFVIPRGELNSNHQKFEISLEFRNVVGYRWKSLFARDFFNTTTFSDLCIVFRNTSRKLYANSQYLSIHSPYFAKRLAKTNSELKTAPFIDNSSEVDDTSEFDVMSLRSDILTTPNKTNCQPVSQWSNDILLQSGNAELATADAANATITLDEVELEDFLVLLSAIYPPGIEITKETVPALISTSYMFEVDHIRWRCEDFLISKEGISSFDLLKRLEYASLYKMTSLQADCLKRLPTANTVREMLEDPRMENIPSEVRSLLLETLLQRLKAESIVDKGSRSVQTSTFSRPTDDSKEEKHVHLVPIQEVSLKKSEGKNLSRESSVSSAALREQLNREMALRKNFELSLKCTREFILQTNTTPTPLQDSKEDTSELNKLNAPTVQVEPVRTQTRAPPVPPCNQPTNRDFLKKLVFDTFDASKLERSKKISIEEGDEKRMYSMHEVFDDILLEPYAPAKCVTYSFVCHFYTKLYKERMIPLLIAHCSRKFDAFPQALVEGIASAIISGFDFHDQLHNDAFMIHKLKVTIEKQLRADFEVLCSNVKAVSEVVGGQFVTATG